MPAAQLSHTSPTFASGPDERRLAATALLLLLRAHALLLSLSGYVGLDHSFASDALRIADGVCHRFGTAVAS